MGKDGKEKGVRVEVSTTFFGHFGRREWKCEMENVRLGWRGREEWRREMEDARDRKGGSNGVGLEGVWREWAGRKEGERGVNL